MLWGISAAGSALHWQCRGHGFEPRMLHQITQIKASQRSSALRLCGKCEVFDLFHATCGNSRALLLFSTGCFAPLVASQRSSALRLCGKCEAFDLFHATFGNSRVFYLLSKDACNDRFCCLYRQQIGRLQATIGKSACNARI